MAAGDPVQRTKLYEQQWIRVKESNYKIQLLDF